MPTESEKTQTKYFCKHFIRRQAEYQNMYKPVDCINRQA